jgi:arsenite methyltransferase
MNHDMTASTLSHLPVQSWQSILDIGFGGGLSLEMLLHAAPQGKVVGVEVSTAMLAQSRAHLSHSIQQGRLELRYGSAEHLPCEDACFDHVCTVNTIYFWSDLRTGMVEIGRVLKPDGHFALGFRAREDMQKLEFTQHNFSLYSLAQVHEELSASGFTVVHTVSAVDKHFPYHCFIARKV